MTQLLFFIYIHSLHLQIIYSSHEKDSFKLTLSLTDSVTIQQSFRLFVSDRHGTCFSTVEKPFGFPKKGNRNVVCQKTQATRKLTREGSYENESRSGCVQNSLLYPHSLFPIVHFYSPLEGVNENKEVNGSFM